MKIKNFKELNSTELRNSALQIAEAGLESIDTKDAVKKYIAEKKLPLKDKEQIFIIGVGKCSLDAVAALEEELGDKVVSGIALDVKQGKLKKVRSIAGDHPFSTQKNAQATKEIIELLEQTDKDDLVLFVISGGGSALLCQPKGHTCEDEAELIKNLFAQGANIEEMNIVRKHLSLARGGYLAKYAYPAKVISLIFSDIPGDNLEFISSGPTVKDTSTIGDAKKIFVKYGIPELPLIETPKEKKYFSNVENILLVSNKLALHAMQDKAKELGYTAHIQTSSLRGEARDVARRIIEELGKEKSKTCFLYGGETTVTIKKQGKGGRNLELALSGLRFIKDSQLLIALASDGHDNTDFAGAVCDIIGRQKANEHGLNIDEMLEKNQSYAFFERTGDYIMTGNTGSNVSDLIIALTL